MLFRHPEINTERNSLMAAHGCPWQQDSVVVSGEQDTAAYNLALLELDLKKETPNPLTKTNMYLDLIPCCPPQKNKKWKTECIFISGEKCRSEQPQDRLLSPLWHCIPYSSKITLWPSGTAPAPAIKFTSQSAKAKMKEKTEPTPLSFEDISPKQLLKYFYLNLTGQN